jgi:hypothetical protein
MANKKITELSANTSPSFSDVLPIVNSGTTKKLSLSGLTDFLSTTELKFPDAPIDGNQYARENGDWAIIQSQLNEITYSAGFTIDTNQVTMLSGWTWTINGIGYTNLVDVIINIPAASDGFRRIDLIVADVLDTFYLVQGIESNDIPVAPNLPADTLQATFITVNGSTVEITPVEGNFVTLDTAQTIVGAKLFTQDIFINNMRVGIGMGNLDTNVVFGAGSFSANTSGTFNVGIGQNSLQKNITGNNNTAIGAFTLANPTASSFNVAIGTAALQNTTTGDQNIGIGASSLRNTTTGLRNIGIGASSLLNNIIGISNTGIGNQALLRSTGDYNVAIGRNAGAAIVSGNKNIIITNDATSSTLGLTNGSNNIYLGSTNTGILTGSSNVIIGAVSGLSSTTNNNIIVADGSGNQRLKINENGIFNLPTIPTINLFGTELLTRNLTTGNIELTPISATTPNLQQVTDISNSTTTGIFVDNPYGTSEFGTQYFGGSPQFKFNTNGDGVEFSSGLAMLINANIEEWFSLQVIDSDNTFDSRITMSPYLVSIGFNSLGANSNIYLDGSGFGIQTAAGGGVGYLRSDNLLGTHSYQLPGIDGVLATEEYIGLNYIPLTGTINGSPVTGPIQMTPYGVVGNIYTTDGTDSSGLYIDITEASIGLENPTSGYNSFMGVFNDRAYISIQDPASRGLSSSFDYTANITDLDYTQKIYVDNIVASSKPYQIYTALLTQTGTNAPTATILENTLGTISFTYIGSGHYRINSTGLFTNNKTFIIFGNVVNNASGQFLNVTALGEDININTIPFVTKVDDVQTNNALLKTPIEIRVYN